MRKIFISYRRNDTDMAAGRLAADLRNHFGEAAVFRDKESIAVGADWEEEIRSAIGADGVVLVLIGNKWLEADAQGQRRIDDPEDTHRGEVAAALKLGCLVIPILVSQAQMPRKENLPEEIRSLTRFNALKLRDDEWNGYDFPRLTAELMKYGFKPQDKSPVLDLVQSSVEKWRDETAGRLDTMRQVTERVKQGLKSESKPASGKSPEPEPSVEKNRSRWSRKLIVSLLLAAVAILGFEEQPDADTLMGVFIFGVAGLVLGVLGWQDARRGLARSPGVGVLAIFLSGFCVLAGLGQVFEYLDADRGDQFGTPAPFSAQLPHAESNLPATPAPMAAVPALPSSTSAVSTVDNTAPLQPVLSGMWGDSLGRTHVLQQNGNHLTLRDVSPASPLRGMILSGTLQDHQVTLSGEVPGEGQVSLYLALTPDGASMSGILLDTTGLRVPYAFFRLPQ